MRDFLLFYSISPQTRFLKRTWYDETVIFLIDARETHLLSATCSHVLAAMVQEGVSSDQLVSTLGEFVDDAELQEVRDLVDKILITLCSMGLIEVQKDVP